jgi:hypothetical protein
MNPPSEATQLRPMPQVPKFWHRFALFIRVGIALALLMTNLGLTGCTGQPLVLTGQPLTWSKADKIISPAVLHDVIQQTTSTPLLHHAQLPVLVARMNSDLGPIVVFNFSQSPQLCGQLGCLFTAYLRQDGQNRFLWSHYLSPAVPQQVPLLAQYGKQAMPSFLVNQVEGNQIRQNLYAWDGNQYQLEQSVLNNQPVDANQPTVSAESDQRFKV